MLTVIVPFRNRAPITAPCIQSILDSFKLLGQPESVEFLFIDDASDAGSEVVPLLTDFRKNSPSATRILRFKERQHYTRACAHAFSLAKGDIFFLSHDMVLAPECVQAMIQVAALDPKNGIVRATSNYVDCFPGHVITPPLPLRDLRDVRNFSRYVAEHFGLTFVEDKLLTGDIMFIKRELVSKIGIMDTRYFGYFGDIDYGLRAQRAGFKLVCAKGAWLLHEGAGFYKQESQAKNINMQIIHAQRMEIVNNAYKLFREKWDPTLPPDYPGTDAIDFNRLRNLSAVSFDLYQPPITVDPKIGEMI